MSSLLLDSGRRMPATSSGAVPFAREADMLTPLVSHIDRAHPSPLGDHFYEVQTLRGVADVVFARFDREALRKRRDHDLSPLTEVIDVAAVRVLEAAARDGENAIAVAEMARRMNVSSSHLRSAVLPRLRDKKWVRLLGNRMSLAGELPVPVKSMVAIEVKRSDWRQALFQAQAYTDFADASYVALDAYRTPGPFLQGEGPFQFAGVGLLTVSTNDGSVVKRLIRPRRRRPRGLAYRVVAERLANMLEQGVRSGEVKSVFGKFLTTSSGVDPRLGVIEDGTPR